MWYVAVRVVGRRQATRLDNVSNDLYDVVALATSFDENAFSENISCKRPILPGYCAECIA